MQGPTPIYPKAGRCAAALIAATSSQALDGTQVRLAGGRQGTAAVREWPDVAKAGTVARAVRNDVVVGFEVADRVVDEAVDLILVGARNPAWRVVNTRELTHPDGLAVCAGVILRKG